MSISRFKRMADGFRKLVELWETTPVSRRTKMIENAMIEDPHFTGEILEYVMNFEDILKMPDMELAEVISKAPPRMTGYAISALGKDVKDRFIRCAIPKIRLEIRDFMDVQIGPREVGGAQLKLVSTARELERVGAIQTKRIPMNTGGR